MTSKANKGQCESTLKSLVTSAQFAYGYSEDRAYGKIKKALKSPKVIKAVKEVLEREVIK